MAGSFPLDLVFSESESPWSSDSSGAFGGIGGGGRLGKVAKADVYVAIACFQSSDLKKPVASLFNSSASLRHFCRKDAVESMRSAKARWQYEIPVSTLRSLHRALWVSVHHPIPPL